MLNLGTVILLGVATAGVAGLFTYRNVKRQGEDNPEIIGVGAGIMAALTVVLIWYFYQ